MSTKLFWAVAACLAVETVAFAQLPAPTAPAPKTGGFASGSALPPAKTAAPAPPPAIVELPNPVPVGVPYQGGICQKCPQVPCVPEVKPKTKVIYSSVCREYCQPERSCLDCLLSQCGLSDDCEEAGGVTRSKTLLVKKVVPKCEPVLCGPVSAGTIMMPPRVSVYPTHP
jgi:hypothetical protein